MTCLPILVAAISTSTAVEEVVVIGSPIDRPRDPTVDQAEISEERLFAARRRGEQVAELLDTVAGARALDFGGPLGERRVSVRGGAPSQLLTIVDGVALGSSFANGIDLGILHPEAVESMRVLRGGQGALYGDGALTGVLLVETRKPKHGSAQSLSLAGGSFGTVSAGGHLASAPISMSASYEQTEGGFEYADRAFGLEDVERRRVNNDARRGSLSLSMDQEVGDNRVKAFAAGAYRRAGVPGLISSENAFARETQANAIARVSVDHPLDVGKLSLGIGSSLLLLSYQDPELALESESRFVVTTADGSAELELPADQTARVFAEVGGEIARSTEHGDPSRFRWSIGLSDELSLGEWTLFLAGRAAGVTGQGTSLLPRVGVRFEPLDGLSLRFGIGRSLRTPTIDELYRPSEAGFSGNSDLVLETAWEAELGATYGFESIRAGASIFARNISDVILYVNRNAFEVRPENLGDARAVGGELELSGGVELGIVRLGAFGSLSLLFSELVESGERLPTQPVWSTASQMDIGVGPIALFSAVRWFGPTSTRAGSDRPETQVPEYLRWDAGLEVRPQDWFSAAVRVTNLLDDRGLQSVNKIPLPGRAILFALSASG